MHGSLHDSPKPAGNYLNTFRHPWHARYERRRLFSVSALHVQILSINVRLSSEGRGWQTFKAQWKSFHFAALPIWRDVLVGVRRVKTLFPLFIFAALLPFPAKRLLIFIDSRFTYVWTSRISFGKGEKWCSGLFGIKFCNFHSLLELFAEKGLMRRINLHDVRVSPKSLWSRCGLRV